MRLLLTLEAAEQWYALPPSINARVRGVPRRLRDWPAVSGAKPLGGMLAGYYRIRTGDYRVQFHVVADEIIVVKIGHTDRFYDE